MRKTIRTAAIGLVGVGIGLGATLLYQGFSAARDDAIAQFMDGERDLAMLSYLREGDTNAIRDGLEASVWQAIHWVHKGRTGLCLIWDDGRVDRFLYSAAQHFKDNPVMTAQLVSEDDAARKADIPATVTNVDMQELFRDLGRYQAREFTETRDIVRLYLTNAVLPGAASTVSSKAAPSAHSDVR